MEKDGGKDGRQGRKKGGEEGEGGRVGCMVVRVCGCMSIDGE